MGSAKARIINENGCQIRMVHSDRVDKARREMISVKDLERLSLTYRVLGDHSRLKIVMALRHNEMCVCDLAALTGVTESGVSHQLRRLKDLSLVKSRREGQVVYYTLDDAHVTQLLNVGLEHIQE